jgi:SAM-dependent methyltransferase
MPRVDYKHNENVHTLEGPRVVMPLIFERTAPTSLLDVGCGIGVWLKAALDLGLKDVQGVDGVPIQPEDLVIPESIFQVRNFTDPFSLGRQFDVVLCLEVAEHIPEEHAKTLIDSLVSHSGTIIFSAACPGQEGQNHVNCQWPFYWQRLFNQRGYVCSDELRDVLWGDSRVEPWYRQNTFVARRALAGAAGKEPRLRSMVHPDIIQGIVNTSTIGRAAFISNGGMPIKWYLKLPFTVLAGRLKRLLTGRSHVATAHPDTD